MPVFFNLTFEIVSDSLPFPSLKPVIHPHPDFMYSHWLVHVLEQTLGVLSLEIQSND